MGKKEHNKGGRPFEVRVPVGAAVIYPGKTQAQVGKLQGSMTGTLTNADFQKATDAWQTKPGKKSWKSLNMQFNSIITDLKDNGLDDILWVATSNGAPQWGSRVPTYSVSKDAPVDLLLAQKYLEAPTASSPTASPMVVPTVLFVSAPGGDYAEVSLTASFKGNLLIAIQGRIRLPILPR